MLTNESFNIQQLFPSRPDWNQRFWDEFNGWLTPEYSRRISLQRLRQWQDIYRYLYNVVFTDRMNIKKRIKLEPENMSSVIHYLQNELLSS